MIPNRPRAGSSPGLELAETEPSGALQRGHSNGIGRPTQRTSQLRTRRGLYENALNGADDADEVVLWNEQGEVTECCTANLVIEKNGTLLTPPVTCGLLPGTYREFLVRRGLIEEAVLSKDDLKKSSCIYLVNAVRKWRKAELLPD